MPFEKFIRPARVSSPMFTIRKGGFFGLNSAAIERFGLGDFSGVVLYFDRNRSLIGIRPVKATNEEGARTFSVRHNSCTISAKAFCDQYGIPRDRPTSFPVEFNDDEGMLVVDISGIVAGE